jgi:hypothetical protein
LGPGPPKNEIEEGAHRIRERQGVMGEKENRSSMSATQSTALTATEAVAEERRINIKLSARSAEDLEKLCDSEKLSISQVVRFGLTLVKLYFEERRNGNILVVATPARRAIKEVVFPY